MLKDATLSDCNQYRYNLFRKWNIDGNNLISFIGLNPSTADANNDDPTLIRCINFSKSLGYDGLILVNLFAYRSPSPKVMKAVEDAVGVKNDIYIIDAIRKTNKTILCWGNNGNHNFRDTELMKMIKTYRNNFYCFGKTAKNCPKHPLYLPKNTTLEPFYMNE